MRSARLVQLTILLSFSLALAVSCAAQGATDNVLTNADIARMLKAGISENIVVREIQTSKTRLDAGATALIELKNQGASDRVLDAVLDRSTGANRTTRELPPASHVSAGSAAPGSFRLPTIEANVRVKSVNDKISVNHNHISVEQAGVPVFSVQWKVKRANPPSK
jgi:hypothetical protein